MTSINSPTVTAPAHFKFQPAVDILRLDNAYGGEISLRSPNNLRGIGAKELI